MQTFGDVQRLFIEQTGLDTARLVALYDLITSKNQVSYLNYGENVDNITCITVFFL